MTVKSNCVVAIAAFSFLGVNPAVTALEMLKAAPTSDSLSDSASDKSIDDEALSVTSSAVARGEKLKGKGKSDLEAKKKFWVVDRGMPDFREECKNIAGRYKDYQGVEHQNWNANQHPAAMFINDAYVPRFGKPHLHCGVLYVGYSLPAKGAGAIVGCDGSMYGGCRYDKLAQICKNSKRWLINPETEESTPDIWLPAKFQRRISTLLVDQTNAVALEIARKFGGDKLPTFNKVKYGAPGDNNENTMEAVEAACSSVGGRNPLEYDIASTVGSSDGTPLRTEEEEAEWKKRMLLGEYDEKVVKMAKHEKKMQRAEEKKAKQAEKAVRKEMKEQEQEQKSVMKAEKNREKVEDKKESTADKIENLKEKITEAELKTEHARMKAEEAQTKLETSGKPCDQVRASAAAARVRAAEKRVRDLKKKLITTQKALDKMPTSASMGAPGPGFLALGESDSKSKKYQKLASIEEDSEDSDESDESSDSEADSDTEATRTS